MPGRASPTARPREGAPADTRERLLETALDAFGELGFEGATTREIARRSGVNLGLFAYYFDGKEDLWRTCVDRAFSELGESVQEVLEQTEELPLREQLERLIRGFLAFAARRPAFNRVMVREGMRGGPRMEWLIDRHVRPFYDFIRRQEQRIRGESAGPPIDPTWLFYLVVGSSLFFTVSPEVHYLTGKDTRSPRVGRSYADAVVAQLLSRLEDEA